MKHLPVTVSTDLAEGSLVEFTTGELAAADDNDTDIAGILVAEILSTDDNYDTVRKVPVMIPTDANAEVRATGQSGFATSDIGGEFGISSAVLLDQGDTGNKIFKVLEVRNSGTDIIGQLKIHGVYR